MPKQSSPHGVTHLTWNYPAHIRPKRSRGWYATVGIIGIITFIYAVATLNFLFAIILVIIGSILVLQSRQTPHLINCQISEDGLTTGVDFFPYDQLKEFWIAYKPPDVKKLYLPFKSSVRPMLVIPLENTNPLTLRKTLLQYLPENTEREDETTSEAISRLLKIG